ncbi:MAG: hypothetical protein ACYC28_09365 [Longimicrobiales bacterium]
MDGLAAYHTALGGTTTNAPGQRRMTANRALDPLAEQVLIGEIVNQSKFAALAADRLASTFDPVEVWASIQSILVATANVSKILWPVRKSSAPRGKQLRELLNVPDESPLFDRTIRNHFEHYDERVEQWFRGAGSAAYRDLSIDPRGPNPWSFTPCSHRQYNPVSQELHFRDESINLAEILAALAEIRATCKSFVLP